MNAPPAKIGGRMALDDAAEHGRLEILRLLLKNDDHPEAFEIQCKRAVTHAPQKGHLLISRISRAHRRPASSEP